MAKIGLRTIVFLSVLVSGGAVATGAYAIGAPQSAACAAAGGTEDGSYCVLPNGDYCESMTLARDNVCKGPDGTVESGDDYGSNEVIEDETVIIEDSSDDYGSDE